jgi:hypothetical protein
MSIQIFTTIASDESEQDTLNVKLKVSVYNGYATVEIFATLQN